MLSGCNVYVASSPFILKLHCLRDSCACSLFIIYKAAKKTARSYTTSSD